MNISIKKLGALRNAEFNLGKKLTVFCGPNNSGKTYAAYIIYALTKSGMKFYKYSDDLKIIASLLKEEEISFKLDYDKIWNYRLEEIKNIKSSLANIFGISDEVVSKLFIDFDINIEESKEDFIKKINSIQLENDINVRSAKIKIIKRKESDDILIALKNELTNREDIEFLSLFLMTKIYSLIAFYPFTSSYILPVERNSIYTFSKELSIQKQEFFERAKALGSNKSKDPFHWYLKSTTRYPMAIKDGLEIAEDLTNISKLRADSYELAEEIENELLQGQISLTQEGDVQFNSIRAKSKKIPIHLSASVVKTLSSLVFYLKHIATPNELIIIDEPELNLHPNNQIILTRIFGKLINKGFRLLISTHSDYVVRELNNMIMASSEKNGVKELANELGYYEDINISPDDINAYLFYFNSATSKVAKVSKIDITETGFDVKTMDETIDRLNNISEELYYSIKYGTTEEND